MSDFEFLMRNLRKLVYSRYSNLLAPEGWGVRVEGVHATNPSNKVVSYFYSNIRDAYAASDGRRMIVIPRKIEKFVENDPNEIFASVVGVEHPYRLEWYQQTIPAGYLEWLADRVEEFLYPFDYKVHMRVWTYRFWWAESMKVDVLIAHPRLDKFSKDGKAVFEKNYRIKESDAFSDASKLVPPYDDLFWDGGE
mgnify:CR=1 FL=1